MPVTTNTSPIIALAKIGRLELLMNLYDTVVITQFVKVESVDKGKELGAPDALIIEKAIKEGWIKVRKLTREQTLRVQKLIRETRIGFGEAGALILGRDEGMFVILDDREARAIAKSWDLDYTGTVMVLYEAFVKKLITFDQLVESLTKLARVMWVSADVIAEVMRRARRVME
jgi:predicted nucleic acid-binding protein